MTVETGKRGSVQLAFGRLDVGGQTSGAIGNRSLLEREKTGLLCSRKCPATVVLEAQDAFRAWAADPDRTVVSAFHSPVEQECLRLLLKGQAAMIVCPAREIGHMRIPADWQAALETGRMLILSPFTQKRANAATIAQRNRFVADLADTLYIPYAGSDGRLATLNESAHATHI